MKRALAYLHFVIPIRSITHVPESYCLQRRQCRWQSKPKHTRVHTLHSMRSRSIIRVWFRGADAQPLPGLWCHGQENAEHVQTTQSNQSDDDGQNRLVMSTHRPILRVELLVMNCGNQSGWVRGDDTHVHTMWWYGCCQEPWECRIEPPRQWHREYSVPWPIIVMGIYTEYNVMKCWPYSQPRQKLTMSIGSWT